ncbi:hypothetical protein H257_07220 [Aphanomyces astaci]|uniref:glucan endo-1,3-beta-D-glucosidase n=1 Tax=Aphanomyces astaci TaxID=112090 RepID=W4GMC4_APHAT|nr:hypothetical protein H257_07220 [Aphanomyces astaci]ETV80038.1 hypothetical protein H257_07220 [Aphanomyces astaci]RQM24074.1 hypothetical protein B5M09_006756 [Aphanomyces astaci]|eukprot:XP_009830974.1 hypothetical protein H257_07220 [Aphanomyces astaci]
MKTVSALVLGLGASAVMALDRPLYGLDYDTRTSEWGGCKSYDTFVADFKVVSSLTTHLRIYTTTDGCIQRLLDAAAKTNIKIWLGLWGNVDVGDAFPSEFKTLQKLVKENRVRNDNVLGIHVSSEALFRHHHTTDWSNRTGVNKLIGYLNQTRAFLRASNLNIPVTIADVVDTYRAAPELYDVVDVVSVNQFSQWEGVLAKDGVNVLFERVADVVLESRKRGKSVLFSETGWSSGGNVSAIKESTPASSARFLNDFMRYTEQQNIAYYYFTAFNLAWGETEFAKVERNFGLFDEKRVINPHVKNVTLGKYHKPVRIWHDGKVVKADGHYSGSFGRLSLGAPAKGLTDTLDREIWFFDQDLLTFRSRSTNQCLDTYADADGNSQVHVYWCDGSNYNQKWRFRGDGTFQVVSKANPIVGGAATVDAKLGKGANRTNDDVTVPVGVLYASSLAAHGRCLRAVGDDIAMMNCQKDAANKFTVRPLDTEEVHIVSADAQWKLTEDYGRVTVSTKSTAGADADAQVWFYDPLLQRIRNKANGRSCLDLVDDKIHGLVQGRVCDHTPSQSWSYNDLTGQVQHLGKVGLCLNAETDGQDLHVVFCDVAEASQKWTFDLVNQ